MSRVLKPSTSESDTSLETSNRKGKTNNKLTIAIPPDWLELELFKALAEKGHDLVPLLIHSYDVVFGPNCHMMTPEMAQDTKLLPVALKAARKRKKLKNETPNES